MSFTKLFSKILASSIWNEDVYTKVVWLTLLAMKNREHIAECSMGGLAHMARVPLQKCREAIAILEAPDHDDSSGVEDGRRVKKVQGGWFIVNSGAYRDSNDCDERRAYMTSYMRAYRKRLRKHSLASVNTSDQIRSEADQKEEKTGVVSQTQRPSGELVLSGDIETPEKKPKKSLRKPESSEEFREYCAKRGISESDALGLWSGWEANGWTRNGKPLQKWKAAVINWQTYGYLASQKRK